MFILRERVNWLFAPIIAASFVVAFATASLADIGFLSTPIGGPPSAPIKVQTVRHVIPNTAKQATVRVQRPVQKAEPAPVVRSGKGCYTEPGTPPAEVLHKESKGDPRVWNRGGYSKHPQGSTASGCWQFIRGTWNGYGGYTNAADAPVSVQNAKAKEVWAGGAGCHHWRQSASQC